MFPRYVFFRLYQKLYERLCVASRLAEEQQQRQEEDAIKVEKKDEDEEDGNEDEEGKEGEGKEGKGRSKVYNRFMAMLVWKPNSLPPHCPTVFCSFCLCKLY